MSILGKFIISSDYGCLALTDPESYTTFVNENWELEQLICHLISEVNQNHIVALECASGNWKIEIHNQLSKTVGYQEINTNIDTNGTLLLVNYDCLTTTAEVLHLT